MNKNIHGFRMNLTPDVMDFYLLITEGFDKEQKYDFSKHAMQDADYQERAVYQIWEDYTITPQQKR
ncbi:hypothetical protein EfmAA610_02750 [Enterococcus faecium]|nr:hypothetical protein EfmAA610_02750 [Enterococcus faecium]